MSWASAIPGGVRLRLYVQPRASRTEITGLHDGALRIRLAAPPVDGAANAALERFLADRLALPQSRLHLVTGAAGRRKVVDVAGAELAAVRQALTGGR